jgi:hypothetical protein
MKNKLILGIALILMSVSAFAQKQEGQYSLEAAYGLGFSGKPALTDTGHYNFGIRYMFEPNWGVKVDFGHDKFRTDTTPENGVNYTRVSAQAVYNLGRSLDLPRVTGGYINALAHAGFGLSQFTSTQTPNKDNMGNLIIGITPQVYIFENMSVQLDFSYVTNVMQHFDYDGSYRHLSDQKSFVGSQLNASIGIIYYLGKRHSDYDWR